MKNEFILTYSAFFISFSNDYLLIQVVNIIHGKVV